MFSAFYIFNSAGFLNAINDALSLLVLTAMMQIGSKMYGQSIMLDYNENFCNDEYMMLKIDEVSVK